ELVGASGPICPFGELENGSFAVRDLLSEALGNPSRRLIVRKASTKSRHDRSIADGSSLQYDNFTPKVEFLEHSVDPEEAKAYREAKGEVKPPTPGTWAPLPFRANPVEGCPRRSCPYGLDAIRSFCRVPNLVSSPVAGEVAESPPDCYFTCYEAYLKLCHL
ncbi:LOW QUALITY PROTEIN: hypothetical protein HID58_048358, partial [Brassica napus]